MTGIKWRCGGKRPGAGRRSTAARLGLAIDACRDDASRTAAATMLLDVVLVLFAAARRGNASAARAYLRGQPEGLPQ